MNTAMFQSIKDALASESKGNSNLNEILRTTPGNTYTVRLLPYSPDPSKTFFHYYSHGWESFSTGRYVQALSLQTFNEADPIAVERFRVMKNGTEEEKERMEAIRRAEKWLVNVYVVDDPSDPENNGKVKILRYGKQLQKIITEAIEGEDSEEFGARIFDLGPDGVDFKVKVEKQGDFPTYVSSRFTTASKLKLSEKEQEEIYNKVFKLDDIFTVKTAAELTQMLDEHFYCKLESAELQAAQKSPEPAISAAAPVEDDHPPFEAEAPSDDELDELLKDL